jgi:EAL domain-containing protein (putative c-di-GMP-specific phosphodiesterase class I)
MTKHPPGRLVIGEGPACAPHPEQLSIRRCDERVPVRMAALIHCHRRFQTVLIDNFSAGGMQLQGCFGVGGGDEIVVELLSGHRLPASVAWSVGSRVGVRFLQPLLPEHPAFVALQQAAQRMRGATTSGAANPRLEMEAHMRRALEHNEFLLHYQPQICVADRRVKGVEALVRWLRPNEVLMPPDQFIPLAEKTGLIAPLGERLLRTACAQMQKWIASGIALQTVAVNLSPRQFYQVDLHKRIREILSETGLRPQCLELEITEGALMDHTGPAASQLAALKSLGVRLAIDDFGTGHSSLAYLKHFTFDKLKLDKSFVRDVTRDGVSVAITKAIIGLAKSLKVEVLAEGVETELQFEFLRTQSCDSAQGYLFGQPVPSTELQALISPQ